MQRIDCWSSFEGRNSQLLQQSFHWRRLFCKVARPMAWPSHTQDPLHMVLCPLGIYRKPKTMLKRGLRRDLDKDDTIRCQTKLKVTVVIYPLPAYAACLAKIVELTQWYQPSPTYLYMIIQYSNILRLALQMSDWLKFCKLLQMTVDIHPSFSHCTIQSLHLPSFANLFVFRWENDSQTI